METTAAEATGAAHATLRCQFCGTWNKIDASRAADRPKCGKCGKPMLLDRPVSLDDDSFSRTISGSEVPVFVDFYADWCGPCKIMAPEVDKLAASYSGRAIVAKLNTDLAQRTSQSFQIRGIPTSIVFVNGKEVARHTGAGPFVTLAALLSKAGL
jgi:thioredoxin 2